MELKDLLQDLWYQVLMDLQYEIGYQNHLVHNILFY